MLKPKELNLNSPAAPVRAPTTTARIIPRSDHTISRSGISPNALRVLYRLREGGFQAFLVGGCVRDLLLGIEPKDFDVATDALPEEVRKLFRNCRLIGRRFRLAHVYFGRDIIEVATFRAATAPSPGQEPLPDPDAEEDEESQTDREDAEIADPDNAEVFGDADTERLFDKTGRIIYDNVYGTVDEDVWRRDFTANALYYNIADFSLWDYVGGAEDIAARRLKLIGDPDTRYREDPVRMLRAARFEAKLGFNLDPATAEPLQRLRGRLADVPPARLFDETLKLFLNGCGARSLEVLRRRGLLAALLPTVDAYLESERGASRSACEKCLHCSRGSSTRVAGARCASSSIRASAPPMTCCCCAPRQVLPRRSARTGGSACRKSHRRNGSPCWTHSEAKPRRVRRARATARAGGGVRAAPVPYEAGR